MVDKDGKKETGSRLNKKQPKKKKGFKSFLLRFFLILLFMFCLVFLAGAGLFVYYAKDAPTLDESQLVDNPSSKIYDMNGDLIAELGTQKRENITASEIPQVLKDAIVSIEDKRFYKHIGVDPIRIVGAAISNLTNGTTQGGSTLTQQLIKLSFFSTKKEDQTLKRKAQEAFLAVKLERTKSKDEILMYYINKVYMSNGVYGMETASEKYFGKKLSELSLAQTALLAGLPQSPTSYDPYVYPDDAKTRRDTVLKAMYENDKITKTEYETAKATAITDGLVPLEAQSDSQKIVDNYLKEVIAEVKEKTGKNVYTDGLDVYTNLDLSAQNQLYSIINSDDYVSYPDDDFQAAVTVVDVKTGQVKAQIGGRKIASDVQLGTNLAVDSTRDVGSTIKPLADYGPAIEYLNDSTGKSIVDEPYNYVGTTTAVNNWDSSYMGTLTLRQALMYSRNVPAVKTLNEVGLDKSQEFLSKLGITIQDGVVQSTAISAGIPTIKMAAAYAAFANGGTYYTPYYVNKITYQDGSEEDYTPTGTTAMKDSTAYMITDILKDVISKGTGTAAKISGLIQAGKTGTSNYKEGTTIIGDQDGVPDISFSGYTTNYAISVWTGYNAYEHSISTSDQKIAAYIYRAMMTYLSQNIDNPDWTKPDSVVKIGNELYVKGHTSDQSTVSTSSSTVPSSSSSSSTSEESATTTLEDSSSTSSESVETPPESSTAPSSTSQDTAVPSSSTNTP